MSKILSPRRLLSRSALLLLVFSFGACAASDRDRRGFIEALEPHLPPPERPVVVVPGFGQTRLWDPEIGRFVWGTQTSTIVKRFPDDLDLPLATAEKPHPVDRLEPRGYTQEQGPLDFAWKLAGPLVESGGYTESPGRRGVYFFEYDWRLGSDYNARKLDEYLAGIRNELGNPELRIDLIGHSLGALVVTTYLSMGVASPQQSPAEWEEASLQVRRGLGTVVTIANPSAGVPESLRFLADGEKFVRREISPRIVATFPVIYELIPDRTDLFFDKASGKALSAGSDNPLFWRTLGFGEPTEEEAESRRILLERAAAIRRAHRTSGTGSMVRLQIGGDCLPTLRRILVREDGSLVFDEKDLEPDERSLIASLFEPGDGSVPRSSAIRFRAPEAIFCDGHHDLTMDPHVHRALIRTLVESSPASVSGGRSQATSPDYR